MLQFSKAGYYALNNSGRSVYTFNSSWKVKKGDFKEAYKFNFDDSEFNYTNIPDGIELMPESYSGCINYQGITWYRKKFYLNEINLNKKVFIYFEAIMGKSDIYINEKLVKTNYGGYLPIIIDATEHLYKDKLNLISVKTDNSDNENYPPGKPQNMLDFTYSGGIYRDAYIITHSDTYITDANYVDKISGGGVFINYEYANPKEALLSLKVDIKNEKNEEFVGKIEISLENKESDVIFNKFKNITIPNDDSLEIIEKYKIENPKLWTMKTPYLHNLKIKIYDNNNILIDGYFIKTGIRTVECRGVNGLYLNGEPYNKPLMGVNRHQDFPVIGNSMTNNLHYRDAKKIKDAGFEVIRNAHYPQDPAFMDACDELGLLVIVNTPGWQHFIDTDEFKNRVYSDIRNMIRRDRNRTSLWLWEPVLNETWYPNEFAEKISNIVKEEHPLKFGNFASDLTAKGNEFYPVVFIHPEVDDDFEKVYKTNVYDNKSHFTREFGDNVDDWYSHNANSRVHRSFGEEALLIQAKHYARPDYKCTCYDSFYRQSKQHIGGTLWHSFDHQRGYHPDPFYGGIMDVYRQPKPSYYMFKSQRSFEVIDEKYESGPVLHIAHEMTPFSSQDVTVYSNCEKVTLQFLNDGEIHTYNKLNKMGMPSPIIKFNNVYKFMECKRKAREGKNSEVYLLAKGYINNEHVITHKVMPSTRPVKIILELDNENQSIIANGSNKYVLIAKLVDWDNNVKTLSDYYIKFYIKGEAQLLANKENNTNPVKTCRGTAPVIFQTTNIPGKIEIIAKVLYKGKMQPISGKIELYSEKDIEKDIFLKEANEEQNNKIYKKQEIIDIDLDEELKLSKENNLGLLEVLNQQDAFGEKIH